MWQDVIVVVSMWHVHHVPSFVLKALYSSIVSIVSIIVIENVVMLTQGLFCTVHYFQMSCGRGHHHHS